MILNPRTPKRYDPDVVDACQKLCAKTPIDVPIRVEANSKEASCWFNVLNKVRAQGGEAVYGWMITDYKHKYILAICHAVWRSPDGNLIDITGAQVPSLSAEKVVFVQDDSLKPFFETFDERNPRPVQRYFPFKHRRLWQIVAERCREADALRLAGKQKEARALLDDLEKSLNKGM